MDTVKNLRFPSKAGELLNRLSFFILSRIVIHYIFNELREGIDMCLCKGHGTLRDTLMKIWYSISKLISIEWR